MKKLTLLFALFSCLSAGAQTQVDADLTFSGTGHELIRALIQGTSNLGAETPTAGRFIRQTSDGTIWIGTGTTWKRVVLRLDDTTLGTIKSYKSESNIINATASLSATMATMGIANAQNASVTGSLSATVSTAGTANASLSYATTAANALLLNASSVVVDGAATGGSTARFGAVEIQPYSYDNAWIGDNIYYNGGLKRRAAGHAHLSHFNGQTWRFSAYPYGAAGSTATGTEILMLGTDGAAIMGATQAGYELTVNGDAYITGTMSAGTVTDRTPGSPEDALSEIAAMEVTGATIDHDTLGSAAVERVYEQPVYSELYDAVTGEKLATVDPPILSEEERESLPADILVLDATEEIHEKSRDLSVTVSMLTRAVQQLTARIEALEEK